MKLHKTTITIYDIEIEVSFYFYKGEKEWFDYRAGVGGPGCDSEVEIQEITHKGENITQIVSMAAFDLMEDKLLEDDWDARV